MSCSLRALPLSLADPRAEMISICQLRGGQEALDVSQMRVTPLTRSVQALKTCSRFLFVLQSYAVNKGEQFPLRSNDYP